jgi:hypothetical protein
MFLDGMLRRAKKTQKNLPSARHYDQIRFRFHTTKTRVGHVNARNEKTRYRLPNVYGYRYYPAAGGLASYGPDPIDAHKRAAGYVDRILKGEKPADLPVQAPTKYALVQDQTRRSAPADLGLSAPPTRFEDLLGKVSANRNQG